jgi:glycosyltransferase involved in cell wall biosynthesis
LFIDHQNIIHSNVLEANQIIRAFIDHNYLIDVVNCWDKDAETTLGNRQYDVIFGFGEPYLTAARRNPNAVKILYLTENNPQVAAEKYEERKKYFTERKRSKRYGISRINDLYNLSQFEVSDYGILLNNPYNAKSSIRYFKKHYLLAPTGLVNSSYKFVENKSEDASRHFVWFGSSGAIHKGLDLLIDVFNEIPYLTLHICGLSKKEKYLLKNKSDNIIDHGLVDVQSEVFLNEIVNKCAFAILPSCSEAMSTGIITCMRHGIIPIVSLDTGLDIHDFGFCMSSYTG